MDGEFFPVHFFVELLLFLDSLSAVVYPVKEVSLPLGKRYYNVTGCSQDFAPFPTQKGEPGAILKQGTWRPAPNRNGPQPERQSFPRNFDVGSIVHSNLLDNFCRLYLKKNNLLKLIYIRDISRINVVL